MMVSATIADRSALTVALHHAQPQPCPVNLPLLGGVLPTEVPEGAIKII